jgi:hypothetical protein
MGAYMDALDPDTGYWGRRFAQLVNWRARGEKVEDSLALGRVAGEPDLAGWLVGDGLVRWRLFQEVEEFADGVVAVLWVAERQRFVYVVPVAASVSDLREVAGFDEIVDDLRRRSLGYADRVGDISEADRTVACDRFQYVRVVRHEPPVVVVVAGGRLHRSLEERRYAKGCCSSACRSTPSSCATVIVATDAVRTFRLPSIR